MCLVNEQCLAYGTNSSLIFLELKKNSKDSSINLDNSNTNNQVIELNSNIYFMASLPNSDQLICACVEDLYFLMKENHIWIKKQMITLTGYGLINCITLSPDSTKLITASINGLVDLFEIKWKKSLISRHFEINFIGSNQILIKNSGRETNQMEVNVLIRSKSEIKKIKILKRRYAVVWTRNSLIFSDLEVATSDTGKNFKQFTEIDWSGGLSTDELRFCFDFESVVLINVIGELYIYQLSNGQLLISIRTDFISTNLMR